MRHQFTFYIDPSAISGDEVYFNSGETHHIRNVLRLQNGQEIIATDGTGWEFHIILQDPDKEHQRGKIVKREILEETPPLPVSITIPCLKGERWLFAVEIACELGVQKIIPVNFVLSQAKWTETRLQKAKKKAIECLKQSGGAFLTQVEEPDDLTGVLQRNSSTEIWFAHQKGRQNSVIRADTLIIVGPESGLDDSEVKILTDLNARSFYLGSRRLRSEIAVAAVLGQISSNFMNTK
ncbi:hypothetical protein CEE37_04515 [candidate division LCP-89 bacterium B3_LCP]|uniref:Ribosomal RNA small subunit methyltransferase E n=1 Tax=candidate division LCP-89 bacterium B3_LCP TaxID=2012998 RepID=A0A532V3P6_UNCL8|nr:MAG: hypothetical protein CEE37_04515 [candidate division LCP-89 bacterium B3_LCP]